MAMLLSRPFKNCVPAEEFFDYPLYFPKSNFPGQKPSEKVNREVECTLGERQKYQQAAAARSEEQKREIEAAKHAPKLNLQRQKFEEAAGGHPSISPQTAGDLARSMGFAPSQADIVALRAQYGNNITFEQFQQWQIGYCIPHTASDKATDLEAIFRNFDTSGSGFLTCKQVRTILGNYGEALTKEEVDAIFKELGVADKSINYHNFVERLIQDTPAF